MPAPSQAQRRADRQLAAHQRATSRLRAWVCLVTGCPQLGEEQLTHGDAGAELHRHYLDRHYQAPATRARSRR